MDSVEEDIQKGEYNLLSKILYGGICSGAIVIPSNFVKIIITLIFPPLGTLLEIIWAGIINEFPYITWNTIYQLLRFDNINKIVYSYVLTSLFYVPGLVYTLANLTIKSTGLKGSVVCDPDTGECINMDNIAAAAKT